MIEEKIEENRKDKTEKKKYRLLILIAFSGFFTLLTCSNLIFEDNVSFTNRLLIIINTIVVFMLIVIVIVYLIRKIIKILK
jgi:glucan phosphoethanolaminetransferase (alkaline phosphatase superfamily)